MKTEFTILNISPTQWVLVDKVYDGSWPILAAYPKIEGVLLLPSTLWEKPTVDNIAKQAIDSLPWGKGVSRDLIKVFKLGYEAAGGYTLEDMLDFGRHVKAEVLLSTTSNSVKGMMHGWERKNSHKSPRALVIDVNEDGSMPSENGAIIYTEVIY